MSIENAQRQIMIGNLVGCSWKRDNFIAEGKGCGNSKDNSQEQY
jgi:hypothetical protein